MSKTFKIFTAGKMGGLSYREQMDWRRELEHKIYDIIAPSTINFIHPPLFFDYSSPNQEMAKQWEINQLINSDIVVFNLSNIQDSLGTIMELGIIEGINRVRERKIFTVGIGVPNFEHPWLESALFKRTYTVEEAAEFIVDYLLI